MQCLVQFAPRKVLCFVYHLFLAMPLTRTHSHWHTHSHRHTHTHADTLTIENKMKKGIRTISFSKTKYDHTVPLFKKHEILPFSELLIFKKASLMWQVTHGYTPLPITNLFERNQHNRLRYVLPRVKADYEKNRLVYSCIKSWNLFSDSIKNTSTFSSFKSKCKKQLLASL